MTDDPLLEPYRFKNITVRNRVFSSAHEPAYSEDGMPKDRYRLYHVEKAKGGIGLTMTAGSAVVAWHVGPYDKLPEAHERIEAYLKENGLERRGAFWEEYWTDPGMEPDPSKWRTRIVTPVKEPKQ